MLQNLLCTQPVRGVSPQHGAQDHLHVGGAAVVVGDPVVYDLLEVGLLALVVGEGHPFVDEVIETDAEGPNI